MKLARVAAVLALVCIPLAACGDEEKKALSKSEYVKQGNAICGEGRAAFNKLFETDFPATPAAVPAFFDKAAPVFEKQIGDLRALDGPAADQAKVDRMLAAGDKAVADFKRASTDAKLGAKLFAGEGGENSVAFDKRAKAVGLKCEDDEPGTKRLDPATFSAEKRAYVRQVDAICRASDKKTSALEQRTFSSFPPELASWAKFIPSIVKIGRADGAKIKRLTPPAADKATIDALIARQEKLVDQFDEAGKLAASGDEPAFLALAQDVFPEGDKLDVDMRAYGFQVCGSGG